MRCSASTQSSGRVNISAALGSTPAGFADEAAPQSPTRKSGSKVADARGTGLPPNIVTDYATLQAMKTDNRKMLAENGQAQAAFWNAIEEADLWPDPFKTPQGRSMIEKIQTWNTARRSRLTQQAGHVQ